MKKLFLETQGVEGGDTKVQNANGFILVECEQQKITFDNFTGKGESYKPRENPLIEIIDKGTVLFSGGFNELLERIKL